MYERRQIRKLPPAVAQLVKGRLPLDVILPPPEK